MKLKMLKSLSGEKLKRVGEVHDFSSDEAIRLVNAGIAEPTNEKAYATLLKKKEKEEIKKEEQEKKVAAIVSRDSMIEEREKLQKRVDELTDVLGDGEEYYKTFEEKENLKNENSDDNKEDDLSQEDEGK